VAHGDFYDSLFGRVYSAYMPRPLLGRPIALILWGGDSKRYYESMAAIGEVPEGGTIVDCPCGAGPALRELDPGAKVRYVAADLSPAMLRRFRRAAARSARSSRSSRVRPRCRWSRQAPTSSSPTGASTASRIPRPP
jgi:hypothetical protein